MANEDSLRFIINDDHLAKLTGNYIEKQEKLKELPKQLEESLGKNILNSKISKLRCSLFGIGYHGEHQKGFSIVLFYLFSYCLAFYWCRDVVLSIFIMFFAAIPIYFSDIIISYFLFSSNREKRDQINAEIKKIDDEIKKMIEPLDNEVQEIKEKIIFHVDSKLELAKGLIFKKRSQSSNFSYNLEKFKRTIDEAYIIQNKTKIEIFDYGYRKYKNYRYREYIDYYYSRTSKIYNPPVCPSTPTPAVTKPYISNGIKENPTTKASIPIERKRNWGAYIKEDDSVTITALDWKAIGKKRYETGLMGQDLVLKYEKDYLESESRYDLAHKVKDVNIDDGNNNGYDILSYFPDGREKYIEVKATTNLQRTPFNISANELDFIYKNPQSSFVYRVEFLDNYLNAKITTLTSQQVESFSKQCVSYAISLK